MYEQFQGTPNSTETQKSEQEKLQEEAKKVRTVLRALNLEKKVRVNTQNKLNAVEREIKELHDESIDSIVEVKFEPFNISQYEALTDEEILKKASILKGVFDREHGLRIAARNKLELAEIELESLKKEKSDNATEVPEIEITSVEQIENLEPDQKNVGTINLKENWDLSKRAEVLTMLQRYESEKRTSDEERNQLIKERDESIEANRKLVEGVAKIGNDYMNNEADLVAAQNAFINTRNELLATQAKVVSIMDELTNTQGRVISTLQELIATQNDLAEANNKLASSEKKVGELDAQVMALLGIIKKHNISIEAY